MTREQFRDWLDGHKALFPEVAEWLAARGKDLPFVLDAWFAAMAHIKPERARSITSDMVSGAVKRPWKDEISSLPACIVAAAPPRIETIEEARRKAEGFHDTP